MIHAIVAVLSLGLPAAGVALVRPDAGAPPGGDKPPAAVKDPGLRRELLARMKEDQDFRNKLVGLEPKRAAGDEAARKQVEALWKEGQEVDRRNTAWMKGVVDKHGWPTRDLVGADGALAAFLLVQHADLDPAFQKKCLPLLAAAVRDRQASPGHLAYLTDRVRLKEGKKQLYGTQMHEVHGKMVPQPIEDEAHVDQRRMEAGLPPLAEYVKLFAPPPATKGARPEKK
jgi:hypothetical protein